MISGTTFKAQPRNNEKEGGGTKGRAQNLAPEFLYGITALLSLQI